MGVRPTLVPLHAIKAQRMGKAPITSHVTLIAHVVTWEVRDGYKGSGGYHWSFAESSIHDLFMQMTKGPISEVFKVRLLAIPVPSGQADVVETMIEECYEDWPELATLSS